MIQMRQEIQSILPCRKQIELARKGRLCRLFLIFLMGCFAGWLYEEVFYWITEGMLRNRGVLYGPWLPIYGAGTLGIYALKPLKKNPVLLFVFSVVIAGVVEYAVGYAGIRFFGMRLWDYKGLFWNLQGIICLRSVMSFGIMALAFHYLLEPVMGKVVSGISRNALYGVSLGLLLLFVIDCIVSMLFRTPITY